MAERISTVARLAPLFLICTTVLSSACTRAGEMIDKLTDDDRSNCVEQYQECLASKLSIERGNHPRESRCTECHDICRVDQYWPTRTHTGHDCQWWHYQ